MNDGPTNPTSDSAHRGPLRIALVYALFGAAWILFSDHILAYFVTDAALLTYWQILKGWFYVSVTALLAYLLTLRLVKSRRDADQRRHESERRFRQIVDTAHEGIGLTDRSGILLLANVRLAALLNCRADELVGQQLADYAAEECRDEILARVRGQQPGQVGRCECRLRRKDGSTWWAELSFSFLRSPDGRESEAFLMFSDVTERRQADEALRRSEQRFRTIFERSPIAIAICDEAGELIAANAAFQAIFGRSDVVRLRLLDDLPLPADTQARTQRGETVRCETSCDVSADRAGEPSTGARRRVDLDVSITPLDGRGRPGRGFLFQMQDVTQSRQLEAQLRQAQKMEAVGQLAGGVSHDFNNILTAVFGTIEVMRDTLGGLPSVPRRLLDGMEQLEHSTQRAAVLTRQLLTFSRRQPIRFELVDVGQVLRDTEKMLRRLIREDVQLRMETANRVWPVWADTGQLEQVVVNLVVNARDAMPHGGVLAITIDNLQVEPTALVRPRTTTAGASAALSAAAAVYSVSTSHSTSTSAPDAGLDSRALVTSRGAGGGASAIFVPPGLESGAYVVLTVSDTGCGIDPQVLPRVFEPFFTTKPPGEGTGLGLATVHGIVKATGGHIHVDSKPGAGTSFRVYLPARPGETAARLARRTTGLAPDGHETILLCEDDDMVRTMAGDALREHGYTVLATGDPAEAQGFAAREGPRVALLVTDVVMRGMNGRQLAESLRAARPDLPVLYISGYSSDAIAHQGMLDAGTELLEKPFSTIRLLQRVRAVLDGAKAAPSADAGQPNGAFASGERAAPRT